jgi:hypothetical protein
VSAGQKTRDRRLVRWLRTHALFVFFLYGAILGTCAFCVARPVFLVNDGHMYMEMARSMGHGSLEVDNGLDAVDSPELWLRHSVKRGAHLYAKYPPLYAVLAALPYAWLGVRGMYLLNAIGLAFVVPAVYVLARRLLSPVRAFAAALLFPLVVPVIPYALMELPHVLSAALVVWAIVLWDESLRASGRGRASWLGGAAGLLAGVALGVRVQDLVLIAPLLAIGCARARGRFWRSVPPLLAFAGALGACLVVVGAFNVARFGSASPLSYGNAIAPPVGQPTIESETTSYFFRPDVAIAAAVPLGLLAAAPLFRRRPRLGLPAAGAIALLLLAPGVRSTLSRMVGAASSLILNASVAGAGWSTPFWTFGWMSKALLASTPFLVLGLWGVVSSCARPARRLPRALAWMAAATIVFLALRDPDPRMGRGSMVFLSLSPRYLVDLFAGFYLLAWRTLRDIPFRRAHWAAGAAAASGLFAFMWVTGPDEGAPFKQAIISTGSIGVAVLLAIAIGTFGARRGAVVASAVAFLVVLANGYACACVFAEDSRAILREAATHQVWGERVLAAIPARAAIVGWRFGKDPILHLRSERPVLIVEPWVDGGETLASTLDALEIKGIGAYYFGAELELANPWLEGRYRTVPVLDDPLLWRLDRVSPGPLAATPQER